jgi:2-oxoglutarate ferredoxin oxidoreductase subunit beta
VLRAVQEALAGLSISPHNLVAVSGIGCSGRISGYINAYTFHSAHGRALPVAEGVKLANPDLTVLAMGGDGDGFAIGLNHSMHAARRDVDITYIMMTNHIYGLTKGQTSPISPKGFVTGTTPYGSAYESFNQPLMMLAAGAGFVAQGVTSQPQKLQELIKAGVNHRGFSYINVFSPCKTFNKVHTYQWFQENLTEAGHNYRSLPDAMAAAVERQGLITGMIYQRNTAVEEGSSR